MATSLLMHLLVTAAIGFGNFAVGDTNKEPLPWQYFPVHPTFERANVADLPQSVIYNDSVVQALHIALHDEKSVVATWLKPTKYNPQSNNAVCKFTADGVKHYQSSGRSYSYSVGCFESTLNAVVMDVSKVSGDVYAKITYQCGDPAFGMSPTYTFKREKPEVANDDEETSHHVIVEEKFQSGSVSMDIAFSDTASKEMDTKDEVFSDENSLLHFAKSSIALIGDISSPAGDDTIETLKLLAAKDRIKLLVHVGDISYNDDYDRFGDPINNSYILTDYMNKVADVTTKIPYMPSPGNHEVQFNFAQYTNWFNIPYEQSRSTSKLWYSFDYMGVHFVSYNSEEDFSIGSAQNNWIKADLEKANKNREKVPWILLYAHRPLYCTCSQIYAIVRCKYQAKFYREYLEEVLHQAKVDVHLAGHNHGYERSYPVYQMTATSHDFKNPKATVYIVNGNAGNVEIKNNKFSPDVPWRAHCNTNSNNGLILMKATQHKLRFVYFDTTVKRVTDHFTITKD